MDEIKEHLAKLCQKFRGGMPNDVIKLQGDGSDRHIYRIFYSDISYIGVYGANKAENEAFVAFTNHFTDHSMPVPEIFEYEPDLGIYVEEDLGDVTLCDYVAGICTDADPGQCAAPVYKKVLQWLPQFQIVVGQTLDFSYCYQSLCFDYDAMMRDLLYFQKRFLDVFKSRDYNADKLASDFSTLAASLARVPADYFMYRDFQSKNIMIVDNEPHFIDYQAGRKGALQYDVASLLFDAYVDISEEFRGQMLDYYLVTVKNNVKENEFLKYFNDFALLRALQALAAFAFLSIEKKKRQFLKSIPCGLKNIEFLLQSKGIFAKLDELRRIFVEDILLNIELRKF